MDPLVQPVSLLPHLLQRDLATLTAQVNLDAADEGAGFRCRQLARAC